MNKTNFSLPSFTTNNYPGFSGNATNNYKKEGLLSDAKLTGLIGRINKGINTDSLNNHPLNQLGQAIQNNSVTKPQGTNKALDLGTYFSGYGKGLVKGQTLNFRVKKIGNKEVTELDFKVNHAFRNKLESIVQEYKKYNPKALSEFLLHSGATHGDTKISNVPFTYNKYINGKWSNDEKVNMGQAHRFDFQGIGRVEIGASPDVISLYDRVRIQTDSKNLADMKFLLSLFEMDQALQPSTKEDIERMKIGQLFRTFCPRIATNFERKPEFFTSSIENLKKKIINLAPEMKTHLEKDLPKMKPVEIVKGKVRYSLPDLAKRAKNLGARALVSGITGATNQGSYQNVASILKTGALSSQVRYDAGLLKAGASSSADHTAGSADSVFTRLLTEKELKKGISKHNLPFGGHVQLIYSLDVLNTMTYQYHHDSYGTRKVTNSYLNRPGILNFVKQENNHFHPSNEVMSKEIIPPKMIVGCMVPNKTAADSLTQELRKNGLVTKKGNKEFINQIPLKEFIRVGTTFTPDVVKNAYAHLS